MKIILDSIPVLISRLLKVMDLAEGHISALNYMEVKSNEDESSGFNKYSTFNLGSGIGYSVLDMINAMRVSLPTNAFSTF